MISVEEGVRITMAALRTVHTSSGLLTYTLIHKRVKNLNLRIDRTGEVILSVPLRCSVSQADEWISTKSNWILAHLTQGTDVPAADLLPELEREACYDLLSQSLDRMMPLVTPLGITRPQLKIRKMKSQWGNCHWSRGYITLNTGLHRCPEHLRDYVTLHELVHFLHHDHGPGFYAVLDELMPEWQKYRKELKHYSSALLN